MNIMTFTALIIDDEPDILELLEITLSRMGLEVHCASNMKAALKLLDKREFDLCLTDMRLPDGDGLEIVKFAQQEYSNLPIAVITAHGSMETAIHALKLGAFDFLSKPININLLRTLVRSALKLSDSEPGHPRQELVGESQVIHDLRGKIKKLARSQAPVCIGGESGTGKELTARMIHEQGPRVDKPFIPVNCGAIPKDLMESEFFGHKKGSFTGAISDNKGFFQAAEGGSLFLDEVAELPLRMQVKLLRAIQEKNIRPVGEQNEVPVDVRIISATHKDLSLLVSRKEFREDLFYRINVIDLFVPPLRERKEDIHRLSDHILERISKNNNISLPELSKDARSLLVSYDFPGNVRELENMLERAVALSERDNISASDLHIPRSRHSSTNLDDNPVANDGELNSYLGDVERHRILDALEETRWNRTAAAKKLGISFRALRYRLQKLNIKK